MGENGSDKIELFEVGDRVFTRVLEGEHEDGSLLMQYGLGTGPFWVGEVIQASDDMACRKLHPQLVTLLNAEGGPVNLFGLETPYPGFWFTKEDPGSTLGSGLGSAEKDRIIGWLHKLQEVLNDAVQNSEMFLVVLNDMERDGYVPEIGFTMGIGRLIKGSKTESEVKPFVQDGSVVTGLFSSDDAKLFSANFHIKLD